MAGKIQASLVGFGRRHEIAHFAPLETGAGDQAVAKRARGLGEMVRDDECVRLIQLPRVSMTRLGLAQYAPCAW